MRLCVTMSKDDSGYVAQCPALGGMFGRGPTAREAFRDCEKLARRYVTETCDSPPDYLEFHLIDIGRYKPLAGGQAMPVERAGRTGVTIPPLSYPTPNHA